MLNKAFLAIPCFQELEQLPQLLDCIHMQKQVTLEVFFCINQPEEYWDNKEKLKICLNNQESISYIQQNCKKPYQIIDCSSIGNGWSKVRGVGAARKILFEKITSVAEPNDVIISLDADCFFAENYIKSILENLHKHPNAVGVHIPYFHPLLDNETHDYSLLRYEIYLRHTMIQLMKIKSPFAIIPLGSAFAIPAKVFQALSGFKPLEAGEDFYFMQKVRKFGPVLLNNDEMVFPSGRASMRVPFGTGPAISNGVKGEFSSYPFFSADSFLELEKAYQMASDGSIFHGECMVSSFAKNIWKKIDPWEEIQRNYAIGKPQERAWHTKFDGLRTLQFLREMEKQNPSKTQWDNVLSLFNHMNSANQIKEETVNLDHLKLIRQELFKLEISLRKEFDSQWDLQRKW